MELPPLVACVNVDVAGCGLNCAQPKALSRSNHNKAVRIVTYLAADLAGEHAGDTGLAAEPATPTGEAVSAGELSAGRPAAGRQPAATGAQARQPHRSVRGTFVELLRFVSFAMEMELLQPLPGDKAWPANRKRGYWSDVVGALEEGIL
jgi:hypothetical protein